VKWPWSKGNGKRAKAVAAEAEYAVIRAQRAAVKRKAHELAELPADEFVARLTHAIRHSPS